MSNGGRWRIVLSVEQDKSVDLSPASNTAIECRRVCAMRALTESDVPELHYIVPVDNLGSISVRGLLSHNRARPLRPTSVADPDVQKRRKKQVPNGLRLHDYVNLYFHARNPMMYLRKEGHENLAVLQIHPAALHTPNAVIATCNASSTYVRFLPSPDGLNQLDGDLVFAEYWTHPDPFEFWRRKSARCAELLIPHALDPTMVLGAYASNARSAATIGSTWPRLPVTLSEHMFFR